MSDEALGITLRGNAELALQYVPQARRLVYRLREQMKWGSKVQGAHERLSDRAYVYAYAMPGMTRAVIVADYDEQDQDLRPVEATKTPDFVSGVVAGGRIVGEVPVLDRFRPTAAAAALHRMPERYALSARFAVRPHPDLPEIDDQDADPPYSQYVLGKSTLWTGAMRMVIQAISAVGKAEAPSIYDRVPPAVLNPQRPDAQPTAYEATLPQQGVRIRYGYTRDRTHGITFAADGRAWLIEISITRGVLAMPLPLFEATTLPRFRQRLVTLNDEAGLELLDRFGGFPSGETFPASTDALESAIRGGFVLRLQAASALSGFNSHASFTPDMGWAFSESGHDAVTSAWRFGADYVQRVSWWGVAITIGSTSSQPESNADALRATLSRVARDEAAEWTLKKLRRLQAPQLAVLSRLARENPSAAYQQLDALTLPPLAQGSARISKRGEGIVWLPRFARQFPPIAFHNSALGFCITHDPRPNSDVGRPAGVHDTVMWVAYQGNRLAWVRYFDDARASNIRVTDTREECMYVGRWEYVVETEPSAPRHTFYTDQFDDREDIVASRSSNVREGADLGYVVTAVVDDVTRPYIGTLFRRRGFKITTTLSSAWESNKVGIVFPQFDRCAYYYAISRRRSASLVTRSVSTIQVTDPHSYETWRNFPGWTGFTVGGNFQRAQHPNGCGPVDARTVTDNAFYEPFQCSEVADRGAWASVCDNADGMVATSPIRPGVTEVSSEPAVERLQVWLSNASAIERFSVSTETQIAPLRTNQTWFITSPDPDSGQRIIAKSYHNCWGDALALLIYKSADGVRTEDRQIIGQPQHPEMVGSLRWDGYALIGRVD